MSLYFIFWSSSFDLENVTKKHWKGNVCSFPCLDTNVTHFFSASENLNIQMKCVKDYSITLYVIRLPFLHLLLRWAGRRRCCLTVVSHGGWAGGWVTPVGASVCAPLKGSAPSHLRTLTGRETSQAHGSGLHLMRTQQDTLFASNRDLL